VREIKHSKFSTQHLHVRKEFIFGIFFLVTTLLASNYYADLRFALNREYSRATLTSLTYEFAATPFQYRVLIPWIVKSLSNVDFLSNYNILAWYRLIEFISTFALIIAFRYYLLLFIEDSIVASMFSFLLFYILPFNYIIPRHINLFYPYDTPSMLFFTLGLILIYKEKWFIYYPLFALATLNRETTCFLTFVFLFTSFGKKPHREVLLHCAAQFVIWVGLKIFLYYYFLGNPGKGFVEMHFAENLRYLTNPGAYPFLFSTMGYTWLFLPFLLSSIGSKFVKRSLLVIIPFMASVMVVANIHELRIYCEMIPVVASAFSIGLFGFIKKADTPPKTSGLFTH